MRAHLSIFLARFRQEMGPADLHGKYVSEKCEGIPDWTECRRKFAGIKSEFFVEKVRWILKMRADSGKGILYSAADPDSW